MKINLFEQESFSFELIRDLFEKVYNRRIDLDYLHWKFMHNPFEETPNIAYIMDSNRLISFYSVSETRLKHGNKEFKCGLLSSAMTDPEYAGQGLFAKMEVYLHDHMFNNKQLSFLYGFANHNAHRIHRKYAGWKDICILNSFYLNSELLNIDIEELKNFSYCVRGIHEFDLQSVKEIIDKNVIYGFTRSIEFLDWRLKDPRNEYKILEISSNLNRDIFGILIFKEYNGCIDIMDFFNLEKYIDFSEIISNALKYLALKRYSKGFYVWLNLHSEEHVIFERIGFKENTFNTYFGYISDNLTINSEKLRFSFIDSDVF